MTVRLRDPRAIGPRSTLPARTGNFTESPARVAARGRPPSPPPPANRGRRRARSEPCVSPLLVFLGQPRAVSLRNRHIAPPTKIASQIMTFTGQVHENPPPYIGA